MTRDHEISEGKEKEERKKREGKSKARKMSEQLLRKTGRGIREKESKQTGDKKTC